MTRNQAREAQAWLLNLMGDHDFTMPAVAFDTIVAALSQQSEPSAWVHEDDPTRVISAAQKAGAVRDGGASASSVRPYSLAAFVCQAQSASPLDAKAAFEVWARGQGLDLLPASEGSLRTYRYLETEHAWRGWANSKPSASPVALTDEQRTKVRDAVAEALGGAYDCLRVWQAWGVGTMGPDDFHPVADDDDRVAEIADAAIGALLASQPSEARDAEHAVYQVYFGHAGWRDVERSDYDRAAENDRRILYTPSTDGAAVRDGERFRGITDTMVALLNEQPLTPAQQKMTGMLDELEVGSITIDHVRTAIDAALAAQREGGAA